jgi:Dolichyl-phosphate-mannose-protein mannosyltransferase
MKASERAAGVLLAVFVLQCLLASRIKSPTFDETGDIAAGVSYLKTRAVRANLQHPPLLKEIGAIPLVLIGVQLPKTAAVRALLAGQPVERAAGSELIAQNGPDRVLFWSRLPFILLAAALGLLLFVWGRQLLGDLPALGALFLYTFDPNIVAHASLVTSDLGFAAFAILFLFALWHYLQKPVLPRVLLAGLALGAVLATKFTAIFLLPVAAILLLAARAKVRDLFVMALVASVLVQVLYLSPGGLYLYRYGIGLVNADHHPDYLVFLAGEFAHRFPAYFAIAWLLKEPLATLLLFVSGVYLLARSRKIPTRTEEFLLLPPITLFAAYAIWADDLGIRYILPVLPFAHLAGGFSLAYLLEPRARWTRPAAALACAWVVLAGIGIYPDHLSYFNEGACLLRDPTRIGIDGGTACGPQWLDDSNVDWGQSLKQLKSWLDAHAPGQQVRLAYFGSFSAKPYGIQAEELAELPESPPPGLYAVSAHLVARFSGELEWLRRPTAIVGHAMYIFDIRN